MALRGVESLLGELEKAKEGLKDVDKNIAKLTGRNPNDPFPRPGQRRISAPAGRGADRSGNEAGVQGRLFNLARRGLSTDDGPVKRRVSDTGFGGRPGQQDFGPPAKRRPSGGAFSRLGPRVMSNRLGPRRNDVNSGDEEDLGKHTVQSSVVATALNAKSREEVAESQSKDRESKGRNRRMFGLLMGTLQRFKDESKVETDKVVKRKAVEQKLEQKAKDEQDNVKKERRKLFHDRQKKEQKIKRLEHKMELVKIHEEWAEQTQMLGNFIRTSAKPHLYYIPKTHMSATKDRLNKTKELLNVIIKDRRKQLEEEIEELMKDEEDGAHNKSLDHDQSMDHDQSLDQSMNEELDPELGEAKEEDKDLDDEMGVDERNVVVGGEDVVKREEELEEGEKMEEGERVEEGEANGLQEGTVSENVEGAEEGMEQVVEESSEQVEEPVGEGERVTEALEVEGDSGGKQGVEGSDVANKENLLVPSKEEVSDKEEEDGEDIHEELHIQPKPVEPSKKHDSDRRESKSDKHRSSSHRSHRDSDRKESERKSSSHRRSRSHRDSQDSKTDREPSHHSRKERDGDKSIEKQSSHRSHSRKENRWDKKDVVVKSSSVKDVEKDLVSKAVEEPSKDDDDDYMEPFSP